MIPDAPILSIRDLTVALPAGSDRPFAVEAASFDLGRSEILCVVGESGSGKSVLSAAVLGALPHPLAIDRGRILFDGENVSGLPQAGWRNLRGRRIAAIPQEPMAALNPTMRVGRQIEEMFAIHTRLDREQRRIEALMLIEEMHLPNPPQIAQRFPHELSGGQCQRICIAMALALRPDVLIADEPTTALDVTTQAKVLGLIRELRQRHGLAVLFITHDLGVAAELADKVGVMERGFMVEQGPAAQVLNEPSHPYTRALIAAAPTLDIGSRARSSAETSSTPCLEAVGLTKFHGSRQTLKPTDLTIDRATTLALVGESGSGKTTLARLLAGMTRPTAGHATVDGVDLARLVGRRLSRSRRAVQMIFQDPLGSLNPRRAVGAVVARAAVLAGDDRAGARVRARQLLRRVGLGDDAYDRRPSAFSGGQRQRIGIARAVALQPALLIADECVSALDVLVQRQILDLLDELRTEFGLTVLFITHDLRVAAQVSDTLAVMQAGQIVELADTTAVLNRPRHAYTKALLAAVPRLNR